MPPSLNPLTPQQERELVVRMATGDTSARNELVMACLSSVECLCRQRLGAGSECSDAVQECMAVLTSRMHTFDPELRRVTSFGSIVASYTLRERCLAVERCHERLRDVPDERAEDPLRELMRRDLGNRVEFALRCIPSRYRDVIEAVQAGQTYMEIGAKRGFGHQRARQLFIRGLQQVRMVAKVAE